MKPDADLIKVFAGIIQKIGLVSKEKRELILNKINSLVRNELKQQGIMGDKRCPYCDAIIKESRYKKHINERCPQKRNDKTGSEQSAGLRNTKTVAASEKDSKQKRCPYFGKSIQILGYRDHTTSCCMRPRKVITSKKEKLSTTDSDTYTTSKYKCRFCGRPPMPGGDVYYSCHSD